MLIRSAGLALALAAVIALGGYFYLRDQTHLVVVAQQVHDIDPRNQTPRLILAVILRNEGADPIEIGNHPTLRVRSINTGGEQSVRPDPQSEPSVRIPPGGSIELTYDLWQLTNLYTQGLFRELRDSPQDMRFALEIQTSEGLCRSDEWSGLTSGSDAGAMLRDLRGGVAL